MHSLCVPPIHLEFTFVFANSLSFSRIHNEFTICTPNLSSFSRNHVKFTILFTLSLWKHYLFRDMNTLYILGINSEFTIYFVNFLWINNLILLWFNIYFANSIWIDLLSSIFFANSLWNTIFFGNSLWIQYVCHKFTICFANGRRIHHEFTIFFKFTLFFANPLSSFNSLSFSRIHYLLLIHSLFREFNICSTNSASFSRKYVEFTILFTLSLWKLYPAISLWIHHIFWESRIVKSVIFCELNLNLLSL